MAGVPSRMQFNHTLHSVPRNNDMTRTNTFNMGTRAPIPNLSSDIHIYNSFSRFSTSFSVSIFFIGNLTMQPLILDDGRELSSFLAQSLQVWSYLPSRLWRPRVPCSLPSNKGWRLLLVLAFRDVWVKAKKPKAVLKKFRILWYYPQASRLKIVPSYQFFKESSETYKLPGHVTTDDHRMIATRRLNWRWLFSLK